MRRLASLHAGVEEGHLALWLLKTEPETWSWEMQVKRGARGEIWSGVRSHMAKNNLIKMKLDERALFYHSGRNKEVVGIVEVIRAAYPDPTDVTGKFVAVDVKAMVSLKQPVSLAAIKAEPRLKNMVLVTNSRLSVQPVTAAEWKIVCAMGAIPAERSVMFPLILALRSPGSRGTPMAGWPRVTDGYMLPKTTEKKGRAPARQLIRC